MGNIFKMNKIEGYNSNSLSCKTLCSTAKRNEYFLINDSLLYNISVYYLNKIQPMLCENFDTIKKASFLESINTDIVFFNLIPPGTKDKGEWKIKGIDYLDGYCDKMINGLANKK